MTYRDEDERRADDLLREALDHALNRWDWVSHRHRVDANLVDAFTSYLLDAGVDERQLVRLLGEAHRTREIVRAAALDPWQA